MKRRTVETRYLVEYCEKFTTHSEAAESLGIHPGSLGTYLREGKCPPIVENFARCLLETDDSEMLLLRASGDRLVALQAFLSAMKIPSHSL